MIVLNSIQRIILLNYLNGFKDEMLKRGIDCRPVKIISGDYILPELMLIDKQWLNIFKTTQGWVYRNVDTSEFIKYTFI